MSSVTYTTPAFLKALGNLAKENQVSNKEFKAKLAHKANRVKQLQRQRKIADQMDKELTKLEKNAAAKEQAKQDKMDAKQAKIAEKETKKQAKEAKIAEKEAKKQARVVTTDTDSDDNVEDEDVAVKTVVKKAAKQSKQVNDVEKAAAKQQAKQAKDDEKAAAKQAKVDEKAAAKQAKVDEKAATKQAKDDEKAVAKQTKQTKKSEKSKAEKNDRTDIIRAICEQLGSSDVREHQTVEV